MYPRIVIDRVSRMDMESVQAMIDTLLYFFNEHLKDKSDSVLERHLYQD